MEYGNEVACENCHRKDFAVTVGMTVNQYALK